MIENPELIGRTGSEAGHASRRDPGGSTTQLKERQHIRIGELRQQSMLGTTARYRLRCIGAEHVQVEVIEAPGLVPGFRMRLGRTAFEAMAAAD